MSVFSALDPYAPKTDKAIPFHKGFILVMKHGSYLTLTAAFLFISVAIQVTCFPFIYVILDCIQLVIVWSYEYYVAE